MAPSRSSAWLPPHGKGLAVAVIAAFRQHDKKFNKKVLDPKGCGFYGQPVVPRSAGHKGRGASARAERQPVTQTKAEGGETRYAN